MEEEKQELLNKPKKTPVPIVTSSRLAREKTTENLKRLNEITNNLI